MKSIARLLSATLLISVMIAPLPAFARDNLSRERGVMVLDAVIARPIGAALTVTGAALYVVTLPFSLASSSSGDAAKALVVEPAKYTFVRCLGCTAAGQKKAFKRSWRRRR